MSCINLSLRRSGAALLGLAMLASVAPSAATTGARGLSPTLPDKGHLATARARVLEFGGLERRYLVQPVDPELGPGPFPVVVLLHGDMQTPEQVWRETSLPTLAGRDRFIVVAPQGLGRRWSEGPGATADEVGFLKAVVADVVARDHGDVSAVFMVGAADGGLMTMRFACDEGETLRAAASVAATLPEHVARDCRTPRPLPWLAINGTDDPLSPFAGQPGGTVRHGQVQPGLKSAEDTFRFWADRDGCAAPVTRAALTDPALDEHHRWVEEAVRGGCVGGQLSRAVVMHGSGHVFPGAALPQPLTERELGPEAPEIDGGSLVWEFFRATLMK